MCTLSLDWISRDFLLAKTCRWLETWRRTGWRHEGGDREGERGKKEKEEGEGMWLRMERRADSEGTHLDAGLVFSYPLTSKNLNVTRHLWGRGSPHDKNTHSQGDSAGLNTNSMSNDHCHKWVSHTVYTVYKHLKSMKFILLDTNLEE